MNSPNNSLRPGNTIVEFVRFTAFLSPDVRPGEPAWWADLTGSQPEQRLSKPARGELQDTGPYGENRNLVLQLQVGRVDWFLTPRVPEGGNPLNETRSIGAFPEEFDMFAALMSRWLNVAPAITRLGFGGVLLDGVQSKQAGYRRLSEYLPSVRIDPVGSEDFLYQINRPRQSQSGIAGLHINRLTKWSVALFRVFKMTVPVTTPPQSALSFLGDESYACRIELDMNTAPDFTGPLTRERLPNLLAELANMAREVGERGDIQ